MKIMDQKTRQKNKKIKLIVFFYIMISANCTTASRDAKLTDARKRFSQKGYIETINIISDISKNDKLDFMELKLRGLSYFNLDKNQLAISDLEKCRELDKAMDKDLLFALGNCYLKINAPDSAFSIFNKILAEVPNDKDALNGRGQSSMKKGNVVLASLDFKKNISLNPTFYKSYNNLGLINESLHLYSQAVNYYNLAISAYSLDDKVFFNRGVSLMYQKKADSASVDFSKAIRLNNTESTYYLNRGMANYMKNDRGGACSDWQKAKEMNNIDAQNYLITYCK